MLNLPQKPNYLTGPIWIEKKIVKHSKNTEFVKLKFILQIGYQIFT